MAGNAKPHPITIDLNQFKLHIELKNRIELTLHFNSPSRKFYLSVIAFVVNEMKRLGKITSIPLEGHHDLLALLNETIGGSAGSSETENLLTRIYMKWQHALPNLEEAPLFKVLGRKKEYDEGAGKTYPFTETEKDIWANLFEYKGSHENVRLKFAIDRIGANLDGVVIVFEDSFNAEAWEKFISGLRKEGVVEKQEPEPDKPFAGEPEVVVPPLERRTTLLPGKYPWVALLAAIVIVLGVITLAIWKIYLTPAPIEVASVDKMKYPLPDVPSIAVLPFVNLSGDPKQEFLCDAMTEEIITTLAKVPKLFVISRNSTSTYKGKSVKVNQVSEDLGVRYVLEGGIQRSHDRIRITVQLIDALTGRHFWAERYERDLKDLFALQDEITIKILTGVQVKLEGGNVSRAEKYAEKYYRGKQGLDCYLKLMQAVGYSQRFNIENNNLAQRMLEEAIATCPENPLAYIHLGWVYYFDFILGTTKSIPETIDKGIELATKALAMDYSIGAHAHGLLCRLYSIKREHDKAIAEGERAVALNPSGWGALTNYGNSLTFAGRPEEAIPLLQKVIRLNPYGPAYMYNNLGRPLLLTGRYEEAVSAYKKAIQLGPDNFYARAELAATYIMMGREEEARAEAVELHRINPKFSLDYYLPGFKDQASAEKVVNAWRKAGADLKK
jgi:adenylate cyclase